MFLMGHWADWWLPFCSLKIRKCKTDSKTDLENMTTSNTVYLCRRCKRWRFEPWVEKMPLQKEMATCSSILAWKIPWTEETGGLQYMGSQESDTIKWLSRHTQHIWIQSVLKCISRLNVWQLLLCYTYWKFPLHQLLFLKIFIFLAMWLLVEGTK